MDNGQISFWRARTRSSQPVLASLEGDLEVDVAIVGAGLTGLWTGWAIKDRDPSLEVVVLEAEEVGFGASGRNGGWLSGKTVGLRSVLEKSSGSRLDVQTADRAVSRAIHEVVSVLGADEIGAIQGGWMQVARSPSQMGRLRDYLERSRAWGVLPDGLDLLEAGDVAERIAIAGALGALYSPDCYRVDPALMIDRLAAVAMSSGVQIYERSRVDRIDHRDVHVGDHKVRASRQVVVATEAYSFWERRQRRRVLPMNSSMIVTSPLSTAQWAEIGWTGAECVSGSAHTYFYAQRTVDGRIAIGGRGKPYRFGSKVDENGRVDDLRDVRALEAVLNGLFPGQGFRTEHAWCGVLGVSRDWSPYIDHDTSTGVTHVGGYAGQGLAAAYVAGGTVADLIVRGTGTPPRLPWVRSMPRRWEPEPLRWMGATALYKAYRVADQLEESSLSSATSWIARVADRVAGR